MSRVVAIVSHPGTVAGLGDLTAEHDVTVVGPSGSDVDLTLHPAGVPAALRPLVAAAWRSPAGRNAVRISPFDRSRLLWRAARRDDALRALVAEADVVVAADRDAVFTVWKMTRRRSFGNRWAAVFGTTAARFLLSR